MNELIENVHSHYIDSYASWHIDQISLIAWITADVELHNSVAVFNVCALSNSSLFFFYFAMILLINNYLHKQY